MQLLTTNSGQILTTIFIVINIASFLVMWHDKHKAIKGNNTTRIPEGLIFFMAVFFGSVGVYLGMFAFRHKTQKWYFLVGIPLLMLQNIITVYVVWRIVIAI